MNNIQFKYITLITFSLLLTALFSCSDSDRTDPGTTPVPEGKSRVNFTLNVSAMTTRASAATEGVINQLRVLVLTENSGDYEYSHEVEITDKGSNIYSSTMEPTSGNIRFYLLANTDLPGLAAGEKEEDIIQRIVSSYTESGPEYIPMFGEATRTQGLSSGEEITIPVRMLRSMATVGVNLKENPGFDWDERFLLKSMEVHRAQSSIQVIPSDYDKTNVKVTVPSIPAGSANTITTDRIATGNNTSPVYTLSGIYLPESVAYTDPVQQSEEATCVIIGGIYLGDNPANTTVSYYRVDFQDGQGGHIGQVLRNHTYQINITDITQEGTKEPEEATSLYITAEVYEWEIDDDTKIIYGPGGDKYLSMSPHDATVAYYIGATQTITINTTYDNYTIQWVKADGTLQGSPVGINEGSVTSEYFRVENNGDHLFITAIAENSGSGATERHEYFMISAGGLTFRIKITQLARNLHEGKYVSMFSFIGLIGNLGDDLLSQGSQDDDAISRVLRNFMKNEDYYGKDGKIAFGGFSMSALPTSTNLTAQMAELFDGILISPQYNCTAAQAQMLVEWLEKSPNRVLIAYLHEVNLINALGKTRGGLSGSSPKHLLSPQVPSFVSNGPFGAIDPNSGLSALITTVTDIYSLNRTQGGEFHCFSYPGEQ
ncbi:MAG: fimbrial protein [Tannerellaceae bacterium]|nr:fimbrial protein [Tannerellaceae bacterium]